MKIFDKWICFLLTAVVVAFVTVPLISILFGVALSKEEARDSHSEKLAARIHKRQLSVTDQDLLMTYAEALSYCKAVNHTLPTPTNQEDEDKLIAHIRRLNDNSCKNFFLGYKENINYMYRSLDGKTTWPSLDVNNKVAIPSLSRDCVEISLRPVKLDKTLPCNSHEIDCILLLHAKEPYCENHVFSCVDIIRDYQHDVVRAFNDAKTMPKYSQVYGMAFLDPDVFPKSLEKNLPKTEEEVSKCFALAVKQTFSYFTPTGKSMNYKSNNFELIDSEYECLGVKPKRDNFTVATVPCDTPSCVLCE